MFEKQYDGTGIVLKKFFPVQKKIVVLDALHGKHVYVPNTEDICLGAVIQYQKDQRYKNRIYHVGNVYVPLELCRTNLLFFHHVLELCYFFLPHAHASCDLYLLVLALYEKNTNVWRQHTKKLFLMKFFALLGIYPYDSALRDPKICRLAAGSLDIIWHETLEFIDESKLDQWLRACLRAHPQLDRFKTGYFLDEGTVV